MNALHWQPPCEQSATDRLMAELYTAAGETALGFSGVRTPVPNPCLLPALLAQSRPLPRRALSPAAPVA